MRSATPRVPWLPQVNQAVFLLFFVLVMLSYAQELDSGPFSWWGRSIALPSSDDNARVGPFALLPGVVLLGMGVGRRATKATRKWAWGDRRILLPLLGISFLALSHLWRQPSAPIAVSLVLFWLCYLFVINDNVGRDSGRLLAPAYVAAFIVIVVVQASVGLAQYAMQRDVGLAWMGEPDLDPRVPGVSIVVKDGSRWLRAYGLNSHPNRLGLKLTTFMLLLWPFVAVASNRLLRRATWLGLVIGYGGVLASLSRSAWLGLAAGLGVYALSWAIGARKGRRLGTVSRSRLALLIAFLIVTLLFLGTSGDVVGGRLAQPSNELEERSVTDRVRAMEVGWEIFRGSPWQGVGLGNLAGAAREVDPFAGTAHLVPLLIAAEMGMPGLLLWVALLAAPLFRRDLMARYTPQAAAWLALASFSMLQPEPTMFKLNTAVSLGMVAGLWARPVSPSVQSAN